MARQEKIEEKGTEQKMTIRDRFHRLRIGFKKRLTKFTIVSIIGLGVNQAALNLTEYLLYLIEPNHPIMSVIFTFLYGFFSFSIIGLVAIAMGIAAATLSNYILNKFWTFKEAEFEQVGTQFLKYALIGASGAILKYILTTAFTTVFLKVIDEIRWAIVPAAALAFIVTVFSNYIWNELWTFNVIDVKEEPVIIPSDKKYDNVTIITPTFNENENIGLLMDYLYINFKGIKLIVADDGSKDGTREQVKKFNSTFPDFILLDRENEKIHGLTISVLDAIKLVNTKYYIVMDCDFQHPPEKVSEITYKLERGNHFVVGEREKIPEWSFTRRLISLGATIIGKLSLWLHHSATCNDIMSGFFGGDTSISKNLIDKYYNKFRPKGYKVLFEMLKFSPKNTKVDKVGFVFSQRKHGQSKISSKHILEFLKSAFP